MFNDDMYGRKRVPPQQGAVGGAPVVNDVVAPKLRRDAAMFAPVTNHFSPDAAAGKLVRSRLAKSGQPMPNEMHPMAQRVPSAADPAMPPPAARITPAMPPPAARLAQAPGPGILQRAAPNAMAGIDSALQSIPGETTAGRAGRGVRAVTEGIKVPFEAAGTAFNAVSGAIGSTAQNFGSGFQLQSPAQAAPNIATPPTTSPIVSIGPKQIASFVNALAGALTRPPGVAGAQAQPPVGAPPSTVIEYTGDGKSGKANAAAPGQVALSERTQQPLPGKPLVGADGSVQYDQAFVTRNPQLISQYESRNVVPSAQVASAAAGAAQPGGLAQAPRGFTREDRARQLEGLTNLGNGYQMSEARDFAKRARMYAMGGDNTQAAAMQQQAAGEAALMNAPPSTSSQAMATQGLVREKQAADIGQQNAKLAMEQDQARIGAEQAGIQTQAQQLQLQQAQQMQALSEQLLQGTPEQKQAAAASLAALQGSKPGEPVKVKRQVPAGVDAMGKPIMGEEEVLYNPQSGQWMEPPKAGGGKQLLGQATGPDKKLYNIYADGSKEEVPQ